MEQTRVGIEFWQDCPAPKVFSTQTKFKEDGTVESQLMRDPAGVEYRRTKTTITQRRRGAPNFVWQRKMWRMG